VCSRPYPSTASAYVELQQQLLQQFANDAASSGLPSSAQHEWLREVCEAAASEWATCVCDILTAARCGSLPAIPCQHIVSDPFVCPSSGGRTHLPGNRESVRVVMRWCLQGLVLPMRSSRWSSRRVSPPPPPPRPTSVLFNCSVITQFSVQVRLDLEEVCRGWATLGVVAENLAGIVKLRECLVQDLH
jgi:hypothetical protein